MATILLLPTAGSTPVARRARSPRPEPIRLTRRGRVVLRGALVLLIGLAVVLTVLIASRPAAAGTGSRPVVVRYHSVLPGETLLQIAADEVPGVDARDTAARIIELNAMRGSSIQAGQRLALPVPE
jgi:hypothetical protein